MAAFLLFYHFLSPLRLLVVCRVLPAGFLSLATCREFLACRPPPLYPLLAVALHHLYRTWLYQNFVAALPHFHRNSLYQNFSAALHKSALPILFSSFTFSLHFALLPNFSLFFPQSTFTPSSLRLYTSITNFCADYRVFLYTKITKPFAFFLFFLYLNFTLRGSPFRPSIISNLIEFVKLIVCKVALLIPRP